MTTSSFHEPPVTLAGPAIDADRSLHLHALDPSWTAWLGPRLSEAVLLEALDETLTRWRAHYVQWHGRCDLYYVIPITTPPGKREWLQPIAGPSRTDDRDRSVRVRAREQLSGLLLLRPAAELLDLPSCNGLERRQQRSEPSCGSDVQGAQIDVSDLHGEQHPDERLNERPEQTLHEVLPERSSPHTNPLLVVVTGEVSRAARHPRDKPFSPRRATFSTLEQIPASARRQRRRFTPHPALKVWLPFIAADIALAVWSWRWWLTIHAGSTLALAAAIVWATFRPNPLHPHKDINTDG